MNFIIFEDGTHDNFYPLSLTKALWDLQCGIFSIRERLTLLINKYYKNVNIFYFTRDYLASFYKLKYPELNINDYSVFNENSELFFINAAIYPDYSAFHLHENSAIVQDNIPIAARIQSRHIKKGTKSIPEMILKSDINTIDNYKKNNEIKKIRYIWELIEINPERIIDDFVLIKKSRKRYKNIVTIIGDKGQLYIEDNVKIDPYVIVDVTKGPVLIKSGTHIHSFTRIEGPSCIGRECIILGAKIREGTTIGDYCRIGGEIENSIFHGYSNKYHDGFIGHSYVGEWVNMGAMTTNSDLKNNYTNVKVYLPGGRVRTGMKKVGCFIGDFSKTSIGTLINTGSSIGIGAMLVHSGSLTPYHIPSFSWYINSSINRKNWLDDFLKSAAEMTSRRGIIFNKEYEDLMRNLFNMIYRKKRGIY